MIGTVQGFWDYHNARGTTGFASASEADVTAALTRGSDYIERVYLPCLKADETTPQVIMATYIAAGYEITSVGFFSKVHIASQEKILTRVEGIQWTPSKASQRDRGAWGAIPKSTEIETLLAPLMVFGGGPLLV